MPFLPTRFSDEKAEGCETELKGGSIDFDSIDKALPVRTRQGKGSCPAGNPITRTLQYHSENGLIRKPGPEDLGRPFFECPIRQLQLQRQKGTVSFGARGVMPLSFVPFQRGFILDILLPPPVATSSPPRPCLVLPSSSRSLPDPRLRGAQ